MLFFCISQKMQQRRTLCSLDTPAIVDPEWDTLWNLCPDNRSPDLSTLDDTTAEMDAQNVADFQANISWIFDTYNSIPLYFDFFMSSSRYDLDPYETQYKDQKGDPGPDHCALLLVTKANHFMFFFFVFFLLFFFFFALFLLV